MNYLRLPFFKRFITVGGVVFTIFLSITYLYYSSHTRLVLHERLKEKAVFINSFLAYSFSNALAMKDDVSLLQIIDQLEKDPDVLSIIVVDDHGEIRYIADQNKIGDQIDDPAMKKAMETGDAAMTSFTNNAGEAVRLVAPLKIQGRAKPLGVVRLDMTFKGTDQSIQHMTDSFFMYAIAAFMLGFFIMGFALQLWVTQPLAYLRAYLHTIGPMSAEANLPEGADDLGQLNAAINGLILKFRNEIHSLVMAQSGQGLQEAELIRQLLGALDPQGRLLLADKDNVIVTDSDPAGEFLRRHLLELAHDEAFEILLSKAFQNEGQLLEGQATLNETPYRMTLLRFSESFSKDVRMLIMLHSPKETTTP